MASRGEGQNSIAVVSPAARLKDEHAGTARERRRMWSPSDRERIRKHEREWARRNPCLDCGTKSFEVAPPPPT
jgi:hypothetical protein